MSFSIHIHTRAAADMEEIHLYISGRSSDSADRTIAFLEQAIMGLREFPNRYAHAPESNRSSIVLRHLIAGNHRVLYTVIGDGVHIWRVVHVAQCAIDPADIF